MMTNSESGNQVQVTQTSSILVLLSRLMWMMFGPVLACIIVYTILTSGSGWLTVWDIAFVIIIGLMLGGRSIEQRSGAAMTATGEPATTQHLERYVKMLLPVAAVIWCAANVLGNHVLT